MTSAVKLRASSVPGLLDCPARWEAIHLKGLTMPKTSAAALGTAVHASTAVYDTGRLTGADLSADDAAGAAVDAIHKPDFDVDWEDNKPNDVEKVAVALHKKYCAEVAPTQEYKAVEVECTELFISDLGISITGTTDRIRVTEDGHYGITDIKTGKTAVRANGKVETKGHAYQLGVYELLAEHGSKLPIKGPAQIVGLNAGKTEKGQRAGKGEIDGARDVLLGDEHVPGVLHTVANIIHAGNFWGNPRSMLCGEKYCPIYKTCHYRK